MLCITSDASGGRSAADSSWSNPRWLAHIGARDKDIPAGHGFERGDSAPDLPRLPGDVNDRVPLLIAGVVISVRTVAISPQKAHIQRCAAGGASGQAGHLVSTSGGILGNRATQPGRATEHKQPHRDS
jgi:hypothetical protein